jgi:hypothetical protein
MFYPSWQWPQISNEEGHSSFKIVWGGEACGFFVWFCLVWGQCRRWNSGPQACQLSALPLSQTQPFPNLSFRKCHSTALSFSPPFFQTPKSRKEKRKIPEELCWWYHGQPQNELYLAFPTWSSSLLVPHTCWAACAVKFLSLYRFVLVLRELCRL